MSVLSLLPCGILVVCVAAVFALVDTRTGRGYALGILSALHLTCTIVVVGGVEILAHTPPSPPATGRQFSITILLLFYFAPSVYIVLTAALGAVIVAGIARRWLWIVGFVAATAIPFLVGAAPYSIWDPQTDGVVRQVGFLGVLLLPEALVLAYSVTRIRRPPSHAPLPASLRRSIDLDGAVIRR
ncbi:MAG: hypothetical protein KGO05_11665 [Chloroflexota bacterium]|nr:hypothetical protein [Chloroflexota bacterium]